MSKWNFRRHLRQEFLQALLAEAEKGGWWSEVLADQDVIVALRNDKVNVYYRGQALFLVEYKNCQVTASTHPKYLLDPGLSRYVRLDGGTTYRSDQLNDALLREWYPGALQRLKSAAKLYSGPEKTGCHKAVVWTRDLLDVEVTFNTDLPEAERGDEGKLPRVDFVTLDAKKEGEAHLVFWEAKAFGNKELGSMGYQKGSNPDVERKVLAQIGKYRTNVLRHGEALLASYKEACLQLHAIYRGQKPYDDTSLIADVALGKRRLMLSPDENPRVNLLLFGFDEAQKTASKNAFNHLRQEIASFGSLAKMIGQPGKAFASRKASEGRKKAKAA